MKLLMTIIATTVLINILIHLKNTITQIGCRWTLLNFSHQKNVFKRTDRYVFSTDSQLTVCKNNQGQTTLLFLLFCLIALTATWLGFAHILGYREKILQREKILACSAWLEQKALKVNSKISKINTHIKKLRALELSSKLTPFPSKVWQTQILFLQSQQQLLALDFFSKSKRLFKECLVFNANNLFLFQHINFFLKRDPVWKTATQKYSGTSSITLAHFFMLLNLNKEPQGFRANRFLQEG